MIFNTHLSNFCGFEFATFKLNTGVSEQQLIELSTELEETFLSQQTELLGHFLLKGSDGIYADVTLATTQQKAEEYCQQWLDNAVALKYLSLLDQDSVSMTFWGKIN